MPLASLQPAMADPPWIGSGSAQEGASDGNGGSAATVGIYAPSSQMFLYSNGTDNTQINYNASSGVSTGGSVGINNNSGVSSSASATQEFEAASNATLNLGCEACGDAPASTLNNVLGYGAGNVLSVIAGGVADGGQELATVSGSSNSTVTNTTDGTTENLAITTTDTVSNTVITGVGADSSVTAQSGSAFDTSVSSTGAAYDGAPLGNGNASANLVLGSTASSNANTSAFNSVFIQEFSTLP